ncbi:MAG: glycosyltransferase [Cyclobacteriaceae bacterium]|nr:glycosyltransferase [Cyclobacteriaceae bacterium]
MSSEKKKFVFLVQGEGRGHMTQAITMFQILTKRGHEVPCVFIGTSKRREIPEYFFTSVPTEIITLASPNFVTDKDNKQIRLFSSIAYNTFFLRRYYASLRTIHQEVQKHKPDVLINFYDFLGGFYFKIFKPATQHVVIGHQFLAGHPSFPFAPGKPLDKILFKTNNAITAMGSKCLLALSFRPYQPLEKGNIFVVPPLVRQEVKKLEVSTEPFLLGYVVNAGYGYEIIEWHARNKEIEMLVFWDNKSHPDGYSPHENLTMHHVNADKFLDFMRRCQGYVSTAGFESICEAMFLKKPVLMIPVAGQYEQACNALDAVDSGAGISDTEFNISRLIEFIPEYQADDSGFANWEEQTESRIPEILENLIDAHRS